MEGVHVIINITIFVTHMVDVRRKPVRSRCVVMYHHRKELKFKLTKTPMVRGTKSNLVLRDQMNKGKKIMVVV